MKRDFCKRLLKQKAPKGLTPLKGYQNQARGLSNYRITSPKEAFLSLSKYQQARVVLPMKPRHLQDVYDVGK
jgi:hypothetical protein